MIAQGSLDDIYRQLQLQRVVHVQVVDLPGGLVERLEELHGVDSVDRQADRLAIRLREHELAVEDLHERLCSFGARLRMFQPEAMDMETAFMKLTEGKTA